MYYFKEKLYYFYFIYNLVSENEMLLTKGKYTGFAMLIPIAIAFITVIWYLVYAIFEYYCIEPGLEFNGASVQEFNLSSTVLIITARAMVNGWNIRIRCTIVINIVGLYLAVISLKISPIRCNLWFMYIWNKLRRENSAIIEITIISSTSEKPLLELELLCIYVPPKKSR